VNWHVRTVYAEAAIAALPKWKLQNLFIGTACNIKRWLRIVAVDKIGFKSYLLALLNALQSAQRFSVSF
jgi:hypothetical protein